LIISLCSPRLRYIQSAKGVRCGLLGSRPKAEASGIGHKTPCFVLKNYFLSVFFLDFIIPVSYFLKIEESGEETLSITRRAFPYKKK